MGSVLAGNTVERVNEAGSRNLVQGSLSSMCQALGMNPITTEGRKDVKRKEGKGGGRKNGRTNEAGTKVNMKLQRSRASRAIAHRVFWGWIFRNALTTPRVSCLCTPHRTINYCRKHTGGDSALGLPRRFKDTFGCVLGV